MAHSHRRGPWVPEEDQLLVQLVREQGPNNWVRISQHMHYRSPKQCRERFHQNLKPSLNREPISADEGLMIERMVNDMGKRWAEIARRLGNRSDNAVKNWWNGSMNRKRRGLSSSTTPFTRTSYSGRVEAPYPRASTLASPISRPRFSSPSSWAEKSRESAAARHTQQAYSTVDKQLSPIYTLPSINRPIDTPLISPAFSETSNAPSMISDNNSISSSSPRTVSSPQFLPLPVDTRKQYGHVRRQSGPEDVCLNPVYQGNKSLESISDTGPKSRWMPELPSWRQHTASLTQSWIMPPEEARTQPLKIESQPSASERDSRMGLSNLLNWSTFAEHMILISFFLLLSCPILHDVYVMSDFFFVITYHSISLFFICFFPFVLYF